MNFRSGSVIFPTVPGTEPLLTRIHKSVNGTTKKRGGGMLPLSLSDAPESNVILFHTYKADQNRSLSLLVLIDLQF